jgi:hypothetical protein
MGQAESVDVAASFKDAAADVDVAVTEAVDSLRGWVCTLFTHCDPGRAALALSFPSTSSFPIL